MKDNALPICFSEAHYHVSKQNNYCTSGAVVVGAHDLEVTTLPSAVLTSEIVTVKGPATDAANSFTLV